MSILLAALFVRVEQASPRPVFPLSLITAYPFRNILMSTLSITIAINTLYFNVPIYFQAVLLDSATNSGLRLMAITAGGLVAGTSTGLVIARWGRTNPPMQLGFVLINVTMVLATCFTRDWSALQYSAVLALAGFSAAMYYPASWMAVLASTKRQCDMAATNTILLVTRSVGSVLAIALSSLVLQNSLSAYLDENVQGPDRLDVIARVREAVEAVRDLDEPYREQVRRSYEMACKTTFEAILAVVVMGLFAVWGIRHLPRIVKK